MAPLQESGVLTILQNALEVQPEPHPLVTKFEHLIDKDFVDFSRLESGCDNLKAYIGLQHIKQRLQEIANFPEINSKTVIAVGGGFSAGKSSFINSLLDNTGKEQLRLATGTRPVTAVPSYLVHSNDLVEICGVNYKNARFTIAASDYEELKHDSTRIGAIRVGSAIKYCTVKLKFKPDLLEQCCLIDIPGYNPGTNDSNILPESDGDDIDMGGEIDWGFLEEEPDAVQSIDELNVSGIEEPSSDYNIARDAIAKADCLIWLFSLEHGPLPANDLEFLKKLDFGRGNKPIYFVGNKADIRTPSDAKACLKQTRQTLDDAGIAYAGICAFSSKTGKVTIRQANSDLDVLEFIRQHNRSKDISQQIDKTLQSIFSIYFKKISAEVDFSNQVLAQLETIERQGMLESVFRPGKRLGIQDKLDELKEEFYLRRKAPSDLATARKVKDKLSACVKEFCSSLDIAQVATKETIFCVGCGKKLEVGTKLCPNCHSFQDCSGRKCPKCGSIAAFGSSFCSKCGFNFNKN